MARGPYKLTLKNNNPDFMHFYLYWDFQGIGVLDFYLSEEVNSEVYDVYLKARANFDSEIGKQIYQENEEFFDDASYFDDVYEVCASCWRRVDPYKLIHPVKIQEGEGGIPDERDYYWDIVASMAYMILSLQSALPNVAVKLIQFIERRQKGDTLFFPYFAKRTAELLSEDTHFDTEFSSFLFPKSLTINNAELSKKNIISYISRCVNDDTQLDIVQQFESMIADTDSMSKKDKEELNQFLRLIETRIIKLCMATPSLEFKDFFLPAKEAETALGYKREPFAAIESSDNSMQQKLSQRFDKISGDLFTEGFDSAEKDETIKKMEAEISRLKSELEEQENKDSNAFPIKPRIRVLVELLKLLNAGPNTNDMTKIARLISYITGSGSKKVYRLIQEGYQLTDFHEEAIKEANDALQDLSIKIKINKD